MVVPLSSMCEGEKGKIRKLELPPVTRERLCGLGFVTGEEIQLVKVAPFGDPKVFRIKGSDITLRDDISMWILVETSSFPLSYVSEGDYWVSLINGGMGFRQRLRMIGIEEGIKISVIGNLGKRIEVSAKGIRSALSRGQAMRIIVRER
ncbi:FeoA family protein [Mesotoga sp. H07pep.5.4]|uniref:FeoA family protein n=1 Tax=Mesotoga sp. H07pep.5.4 TaxID=1463664 RepID=UPI000EF13F2F|nr:FeoA family protein [Mesotoga sp. H07pep.5.4]RLL85798.1 FeoA family protein [Mesotoga sp. H07pep.5.4]